MFEALPGQSAALHALPARAALPVQGEGGGAPACPLPCRAALSIAAAETGLGVDELLSSRRCVARVAQARQLAMYLAHVALGLPQTEVARAFQRDRTTVAHACRRIEDMRDVAAFDAAVSRMENGVRWIVKG